MVNVCFGGTLTQDIRKMQQEKHFDILRKNYGSHLVKLDSHSQLAAVLDRDVASVNSLHHQAVDRVGAGLRAVARSEDGFVEALEIADYGFGIAGTCCGIPAVNLLGRLAELLLRRWSR